MFKIGDIIKDVEDGDCYFIGQITEIKNNEVIKYKLLKIIWNGEEEIESEELNTEIEPRWWYMEIINEFQKTTK
jgi:hypothetical protein